MIFCKYKKIQELVIKFEFVLYFTKRAKFTKFLLVNEFIFLFSVTQFFESRITIFLSCNLIGNL